MADRLQSHDSSRSLAPDREAAERSGSELTLLNSGSSSSITVDRSKDLRSHHCLDVVQLNWTDEKHRLYLDSLEASFVKELHQRRHFRTDEKHGLYLNSLEASFVKELHQSRHFRAFCSQQKMCRKQPMSKISSSQLMVLQDVPRKKVKFEKNDPLLDSTADSPATLEDLWTNQFSSSGKQCTLETPVLLEERGNCGDGRHLRNLTDSFGSSQHYPICHHDSVATTTEVSGQNFVDSHQRGLSAGMSIRKRLKRDTA